MTPEEQARALIEPYAWRANKLAERTVNESAVIFLLSDKIKRIAELEKQMEEMKKPCVWEYDEYYDKWDTACNEAWTFTEGTPQDNNVKFCPFCGHPVEIKKEE